MKRLFLFILALTFSLFYQQNWCKAADIAPDTQKEATSWWRGKLNTVSPGKLTVVTSPDFAPYEFYAIDKDGNAQLAGFEISLAQYIANYLGLELDIVAVDFDATMTELQTKSVDLGMAGYSPKPERANIMDFSDVFYTSDQSFVCLQKNRHLFNSLQDTNQSKYSIGAQSGSIQFDLAKKYSPSSDIVLLPKVTDVFSDLLAGNLDGVYIETVIAESYKKNYPIIEIALAVPYDHAGSVIGVSKGNEALLAAVNEAIAAALSDGSMERFVLEAIELSMDNESVNAPQNSQSEPLQK